jgi:ATP-dependent DNA ligase
MRKTIVYSKFMYLWPPRPKTAMKPFSPQFEKIKEKSNYRAQLKLNGQRNVIYISPKGEVDMWNRHKERHRNYKLPDWLRDQILDVLDIKKKWIVIDGELLHAKDATTKNILYWWDVLVCDNEYLLGHTYEERFQMLRDRVKTQESENWISKATDNIWVADMIGPEDYEKAWEQTATSYVEGFVFKDIKSKLAPCIGEKNNGIWQVRCRKPHSGGNYKF